MASAATVEADKVAFALAFALALGVSASAFALSIPFPGGAPGLTPILALCLPLGPAFARPLSSAHDSVELLDLLHELPDLAAVLHLADVHGGHVGGCGLNLDCGAPVREVVGQLLAEVQVGWESPAFESLVIHGLRDHGEQGRCPYALLDTVVEPALVLRDGDFPLLQSPVEL